MTLGKDPLRPGKKRRVRLGKKRTVLKEPLPDYDNPPVTEVVCGVLAKPIEALLVPHFGLFWDRLKKDFPRCEEVAPLKPAIETFESPLPPKLTITDVPPVPRVWFVHEKRNAVIQVQRDRFLYNWRKLTERDQYPRYGRVFADFRDHLAAFSSFLESEGLGTLEYLQFELTYVNHVPQGDGWQSLNDLDRVFPDYPWGARAQRHLTERESISFQTAFVLPERQGRLRATLRDAIRQSDNHPILLFELTARGISSSLSMDDWFSMAHEAIVRTFSDSTSLEVQRSVWRRR